MTMQSTSSARRDNISEDLTIPGIPRGYSCRVFQSSFCEEGERDLSEYVLPALLKPICLLLRP